MSISKSYNNRTGTTYVYEVLSNQWNKEKQRSETKRRLIGKIDPVTGEIIPTKPRKKKSSDTAAQTTPSAAVDPTADSYKDRYEALLADSLEKDKQISALQQQVADLKANQKKFMEALETLSRKYLGGN